MPAQIQDNDSMFSVREMPWHGEGAVIEESPKSITEALTMSGLDWTVEQTEIYFHPPGTENDEVRQYVQAQDLIANVRSDDLSVLGVVTDEYKVVNNVDAFRFMDDILGTDEIVYETAGSLYGGRKTWVLAHLPDFIEVGGDETGTYLFVANSHDGTMAVTASVTPIRIVCANTLTAAIRGAKRAYKFRHTGDLSLKYAEARNVMEIAVDYEKRFKELGDQLATVPFTKDQLKDKVLDKLFVINDETGDKAKTIRETTIEEIMDLFDGRGPDGDTTGNSPNTKWAAYNAVAEYADYGRRVTTRTNQIVRSFEDTGLKDRAFDLVVNA